MEVLNIKDLKSGVILFGNAVQYIYFLTEAVQYLGSVDVVKAWEATQINFKNVCKLGMIFIFNTEPKIMFLTQIS